MAGEMGIEYNVDNTSMPMSAPQKYRSSAGADKAVPTGTTFLYNGNFWKMSNLGTNIETVTTIQDAEANVSISGVEQRHMLMQRLSRAPQTRVMCLRNMITAAELDGEVSSTLDTHVLTTHYFVYFL